MRNCQVVSRIPLLFEDREDAGRRLAREFSYLEYQKPAVVGVPRGGLLVAQALAEGLHAPFDFVLAHKLSFPGNKELALGAVAPGVRPVLDHELVQGLPDSEYLHAEKIRQLTSMRARSRIYRKILSPLNLAGRVVIVADDGAAMGYTLVAALRAVRCQNPYHVIAALPTASREALLRIGREAHSVICLCEPPVFSCVGDFYKSFSQVGEWECIRVLRRAALARKEVLKEGGWEHEDL